MIHLISIVGKHARDFYLKQACISDFKSLIRTVTSGRIMIISTKFRSDLFYHAEQAENKPILKLWALYANVKPDEFDAEHIVTSVGHEESLTQYFQSINKLSTNWLYYRQYKEVFALIFTNDRQNPVARTIVACDQALIAHPSITRGPLVDINEKIKTKLTTDTFALAMHIINSQTHDN